MHLARKTLRATQTGCGIEGQEEEARGCDVVGAGTSEAGSAGNSSERMRTLTAYREVCRLRQKIRKATARQAQRELARQIPAKAALGAAVG